MPRSVQQLRRVCTRAEAPRPKKDVVWLTSSAGIWTEFKGDRGTKSKPIPGPHLVYGFPITEANAMVKPIHPKAMPMIRQM